MSLPHSSAVSMQRLQSVDRRAGFWACLALQPLRWRRMRATADEPASELLLIKFWGIGSLQLLTPAVATLRRRHPGARLTLLTLRENEEFARGLRVFDDIVTLDVRAHSGVRGTFALAGRIASLVRRLRARRYQRVYDFEFFTRFSALVSLLSGAPRTVGFEAPNVWRGDFHAERVQFNRYWHVARNFRALAGGEDGRDVTPADVAPFAVDDAARAAVARQLLERGLAADRPYVVLNPNAGQLSLERRWPPASFATLARRLGEEDGVAVVLVGSRGEADYVGRIAAQIGRTRDVVDLSGALSIGELCALLAGAAAVVSNDSGPMHLAAALDAPTLGLFGPETPVMYRPLSERARFLWKPPACSPCINVHDNKVANCIHGRPECLVNVTPDEVLDETRAMLVQAALSNGSRARGRLHVLGNELTLDHDRSERA